MATAPRATATVSGACQYRSEQSQRFFGSRSARELNGEALKSNHLLWIAQQVHSTSRGSRQQKDDLHDGCQTRSQKHAGRHRPPQA